MRVTNMKAADGNTQIHVSPMEDRSTANKSTTVYLSVKSEDSVFGLSLALENDEAVAFAKLLMRAAKEARE